MTSPTPAGSSAPGRGGKSFLGLPVWAWAVLGAATLGAGAYIFIKNRQSSQAAGSGTDTTQGVSTVTVPSDQQIGLTQYEQIQSSLVGIEGTDQALLAAIKDLQGDESKDGDKDHDCPAGHHWDAKTRKCVKNSAHRERCSRGYHWDESARRCVKNKTSGGGREVRVPDVEGERRAQAARRIRGAGLQPKFREPFAGPVKTEQPAAGRRVRRGSTVELASRKPHSPGK